MKRRFKSVLIFTLICIIFSTIVAFATAGDSNDPLVTLSYITDVLMPNINGRIDQNTTFRLVNVKAGYKIIGEEGTEFVLRSGTATIIATSSGGVADLTDGIDLPSGSKVTKNHHMLIPRSDNRGMVFTVDGIVMARGNYTVSKK